MVDDEELSKLKLGTSISGSLRMIRATLARVAPVSFLLVALVAGLQTINSSTVPSRSLSRSASNASFTGITGYDMVGQNGAVYAFNVPSRGQLAGTTLNRPIVGMAATADRAGYWLVASDGGIFSFGDAQFYGSTGAITLNKPIVGIAPSPDGGGYWLAASDGGIFSFGDATYYGSAASPTTPVSAPVVGILSMAMPTVYSPGATGFDISNFQCPAFPPPSPVSVIEVTGWSFSFQNPCLAQEFQWGGPSTTLYAWLNWPSNGASSPTDYGSASYMTGPAGNCAPTDFNCQAYNFGYKQAQYAYQYAQTQNVMSSTWWLDVETGGQWAALTQGPTFESPAAQAQDYQDILGAINFFTSQGRTIGVYSTPLQWSEITGGATLPANTPIWVALPGANPSTACSQSNSFGQAQIWLVQTGTATLNGHTYDTDLSC